MCFFYTLFAYFAGSKLLALATKKLSQEKVAELGISPKPNGKTVKTAKPLNDETHQNGDVNGSVKKIEKKSTANKIEKKPYADKTVKKAISPKKAAVKRIPKKPAIVPATMIGVEFRVRFHTTPGQQLFISGNHEILGNDDELKALPMQYLDKDHWSVTVDIPQTDSFNYHYILKNEDGSLSYDWGNDKEFCATGFNSKKALVIDSWNHAGYFENVFYTEPFKNVLLDRISFSNKKALSKNFTHQFKVKAPLLKYGQAICLIGSSALLGNWNTSKPLLLNKDPQNDYWSIQLDLSKELFPIQYKYGVFNTLSNSFNQYEDGNNRVLYRFSQALQQVSLNDGFVKLPANTWKGTGVAIPVFSLRSKRSFGVGEFTDLTLLVDWARQVGMKMVQILPVNDTSATHTWKDSYPYAAISAFALHPIYLNLEATTDAKNKKLLKKYLQQGKELNQLSEIDYCDVIKAKWKFIREIFPLQSKATFESDSFSEFFKTNKYWLESYAVFCYLKDEYGTSDFNQWPSYSKYNTEEISELLKEDSAAYGKISIHFFVQYHLHLQLKAATQYAHDNGIIVKGDIPIGIYRYGADAWQHPELYHIEVQAGAPPDDFAVKGQNWGFPTYNWERMKEDGFAWWRQRFEQMSYYFDAFRIDHILGFFRIWSIPLHAVEGIMGYFVPAIPVYRNEFNEKGIWFDQLRYTRPYITDDVLWKIFGSKNDYVKSEFLNYDGFDHYVLKDDFNTQRKVEAYFNSKNNNEESTALKNGLYDLISNVILFEVDGSNGAQFHFRFAMQQTLSFQALDGNLQNQLNELYTNYYFRRQDNYWMKEALKKLPGLKRSTNMLICGEDLGLVPESVPHVMKDLGILSLEIQRMPKDPKKQFFHPSDAPYLSVVTPSTHDMSTIRGWWEEDRNVTQQFYNSVLGQHGEAPAYCEPWINKAIVLQHLYSPCMWSIFQLQDLLGSDESLRRTNPAEERINLPADPNHYWRYRMHIDLEELLNADAFNEDLRDNIRLAGRN